MRVVAEKLGHACRYYKLGHAWANGKKQSEEMRNREREKLGHEWATKRDTQDRSEGQVEDMGTGKAGTCMGILKRYVGQKRRASRRLGVVKAGT